MRIRATLEEIDGKLRASCIDFEASGEGATREQALAALKEAVRDRLAPEAVAPPAQSLVVPIDVVLIEGNAVEHAKEPTGPGDRR